MVSAWQGTRFAKELQTRLGEVGLISIDVVDRLETICV